MKFPIRLQTCVFLVAGSLMGQQKVLVTCDGGTCEYRRVAGITVSGKRSVRALKSVSAAGASSDLKMGQEIPIDALHGLYRDPATGIIATLAENGTPETVVIPSKVNSKEAVQPAAVWQSATIEYRDSLKAKGGTGIKPGAFTALLTLSDTQEFVVDFLQFLINTRTSEPRLQPVIRAGLQFADKSPALVAWRSSLLSKMQTELTRYVQMDGDPTALAESLRDAVAARDVYLRIATPDKDQQDLVSRVSAADELFQRRFAIAQTFRKVAFWDEYLEKIDQLGLAKWSTPNLVKETREAIVQSVSFHHERAAHFESGSLWDQAFDEAGRAAALKPCDSSITDDFYRLRIEFVNNNMVPQVQSYDGRFKAQLDQIARELEQLDTSKETSILERIARGEKLDARYLPLQWKKIEFLNMLGKFTEALDVVRKIERTTPMDKTSMEEALRLEGRISINLADARRKAEEEVKKQFANEKYQAALDAVITGLKADPSDMTLLYYGALAAGFLRQNELARQYTRTYLNSGSLVCAADGQPEKMLELYQILLHRAALSQTAGVPNWVSGRRYMPGDAYYDPISLAFTQPVRMINTKKGSTTLFQWEDRSYVLRSISTFFQPQGNNSTKSTTPTPVFGAEPRYDRKALSMLEIGSPATTTGQRNLYSLTYLNSPGVDPDLVFRFTGKQIARGWAGNPFFHPFIWTGFYLFDLTYDSLGRVITATPVKEEAGARPDPYSEPLQFTWQGNSNRLLTIHGVRSSYTRELAYDKQGRLKSEKISHPKGNGSIDYEYVNESLLPSAARADDNFYDRAQRIVQFEVSQRAAVAR
jgi:tetratricopeptide (TPR) repeat protein